MAPPYVENADITLTPTNDGSSVSNKVSVEYSCKTDYFTKDESVSVTLDCETSSGWEEQALPECVKGWYFWYNY